VNEMCALTVHPRIGKRLKMCPYTHIINGQIKSGRLVQRECKAMMIIFIPVNPPLAARHKALVIVRPHNHPAHPKTKPSTSDQNLLGQAITAAGSLRLTVSKLLNGEPIYCFNRKPLIIYLAPSTNLIYGGERVSSSSPAYINSRKVMDFINEKKKKDHPQGMGWAGNMDEWEVASMSDRFKQRITFASLFCDVKTTEAFTQLFTELFDTIARVTGKPLKLAPFFPDAKCRIVMLDGEVPQALGLGHFLVGYNDPEISDELPRNIPRTVIMRLKSILSLNSQHEIDAWHDFCAAQAHNDIKNWYAHKRANPWIPPSVNKFLSAITNESWDITPSHSNIVETAHAGRNVETSIGVGLLTAILQSQVRDNAKAAELLQIEQKGVMRKRWNGVGEREKLSAQRKVWRMRKSAVRTDQLTSFESLKAERNAGTEENKASLQREKIFQSEIKSLQDDMKLDSHRSDLREQINTLRREIEEEKDARRAWRLRQIEIDSELERLRKGSLAGVRINGRRPA
ncbi:hypothetical protein B0H14DRAFT_3787817, partial [Mycena olivaceomarginata]